MDASARPSASPADPASPPSRRPRSLLLGVLTAAGVAFALLQWGPAVRHWYADPFRCVAVQTYVPPEVRVLGRTIHLPVHDRMGRAIPRADLIVVAPAPCGSCADPALWARQLAERTPVPVVALCSGLDRAMAAAPASAAPQIYRVDPASVGRAGADVVAVAPLFAAADRAGRVVGVSRPREGVGAFAERMAQR